MKFLKLPVAPREAALAGSGIASPATGGEAGHNPLAGSLALQGPRLHFHEVKFPSTVGANLSELRFTHGWHKLALHGGGKALVYQDLEGRDADGFTTGNYGASAWALDAGLSGERGRFSYGFTMRYARQNIEQWYAQAFLMDAGLAYSLAPWLRVASRLANLGHIFSYDTEREYVPLLLQSGISLDLPLPGPVRWSAHTDVRRRSDENSAILVGLEGNWRNLLYLRLGMPAQEMANVSAGLGVKAGVLQLDYAFSAGPNLGGRHHFGVGLAF